MSVNGHYLAAAIAFYGFLSIFPLSIALITLSRLFIGIEDFEDRLVQGITQQIPVLDETEGLPFVENFVRNISGNSALTSSLAGFGMFIAGLGVFGSIRKSVNIIWGISRPRPFLIEKMIDFILMLGASIFLFISLLVSAVLSFLQDITNLLFPDDIFVLPAVVQIAAIIVPAIITYVVFVVIYWWLPNTKVRLAEILGVAFLTAIIFETVKFIFILFLRNSSGSLSSIYGSISTIMVFFFFVYIQAIVLLGGAMLSAKWANFLRIKDQRRQNAAMMINLRRIHRTSHLPFLTLGDLNGSADERSGHARVG